ncbi:MAG: response regulator [Anaerolineae bacterium]|nr:response regulator [Anaerolineae bacterium]
MSAEKSLGRLLVIEQDASLAQTLQQHFESEGYQVEIALSGREGLEKARTTHPRLILLAARLGDISGLDTFRILRDKARTSHLPVMMMAGIEHARLQYEVLDLGAYDFIEKPIDLDILALRVRNVLRRAEREGNTEARTGLPTGRVLDERVNGLADRLGWYKIELTIDHFADFRDLYGFVTANEALRFAGTLITQIVNEHGSTDNFVGHRSGTETFVVITTLGRGAALRQALEDRVTNELRSFYNFMERDQGYVLVEDGAGAYKQRPLMTARITIEQGEPDPDAANDEDVWEDADQNDQNVSSDDPGSNGPDSPFTW